MGWTGRRAPILSVALDVADHVLLTDRAQIVVTGGANLVQEPADDREMANDGPRRQATLNTLRYQTP
jgi:hypothetical protein